MISSETYTVTLNDGDNPARPSQRSTIFTVRSISTPFLFRTNKTAALGAMLLEIGLWESLSQLDGSALLTPPANSTIRETAEATQARLLKHAKRRLGFYTGEKYQRVVINCLQGSFGVEFDDRLGSRLSAEFRRVVIDVLAAIGGCV